MSRTGVEPKPAWQTIPLQVRSAVEAELGAEVIRGARIWGGYSPAPTFRLRLADGRRVFFKATGPDDNQFSRAALVREERFYHHLEHVIAPWAPRLLAAIEEGGWRGLLLEDLGPKSVPPWTDASARGVARGFGDFHRSVANAPLPDWLLRYGRHFKAEVRHWEWVAEAENAELVAALAGERADEARTWLCAHGPGLAKVTGGLLEVSDGLSLIHGDTRSDNLRWTAGRLRLFDWPHAGEGPPEYDLAAFAQTVTVEGGPEPEQVVAWYAERAPVREEVLDAAVAGVAGFFLDAAWRPEVPGLPRLRSFQRAQLRVTLAWAARRLRLPTPPL
jgi:Ser/Thr protein kinase RdoA (MazF antagonist)